MQDNTTQRTGNLSGMSAGQAHDVPNLSAPEQLSNPKPGTASDAVSPSSTPKPPDVCHTLPEPVPNCAYGQLQHAKFLPL